MEMWTGSQSCLTHQSHHLTLLDRPAGANIRRDTREVRVSAGKTARMFYSHEVPVSAVPSRKCHRSIGYSHDGTSRRRGIVRRQVSALRAQNRMHAPVCEAGTDPRREL